jgi:membrane-bound serine protease (ClpP class)
VRSAKSLIVAAVAAAAFLTVSGAVAQSTKDPIVVIEVNDPIDQRVLDFIVSSLETPDAHAFVLKINSPGVSSGDPTKAYQAVVEAGAPVVAWIGPNPAVAYGGAAYLANHADIRSAAPGVKIGYLDPAVLRSGEGTPSARPGEDRTAWLASEAALGSATRTVTADDGAIYGFVDRVDPALGQLIVSLDGITVSRGADQTFVLDTATTQTINGQEVVVASRPVTFVKAGLLDRFLRLGSRPETAFLFLVFALAFAAFEFYAAGSGLMAGVAGLAMIPAGYGLATLPMWWPAVGLVLIGFALLVWGFVQNRIDWRAALGGVAILAGGLTFTSSRPGYPPVIWLVVVAAAGAGLFVWYSLTTVVRGRFATPTVGRESMLGRRCVAVDRLDPIGVVLLDGARWRATADRGVRIDPGAPVEVVGVTGLLLEVDPLGSPTQRPTP